MSPSFIAKQCYVAPANPAGRQLATQLAITGMQVIGLVDNLKTGDDIQTLPASFAPGVIVVVAAGPSQLNVVAGLLARGVPRKIIYLQHDPVNPLSLRPYSRLRVVLFQSLKWLNKLAVRVSCTLIKKHYVVYYAEDFVDTNLLLQFRFHQQHYPTEALLVCRNILRQPQLHTWGRIVEINSFLKLCWYLGRARVVVIDHEYADGAFSAFRPYLKLVQLWHGLPYKYISGNSHILTRPDCSFISSSDWYNHHVFNRLFRAENYLTYGYARNDVFLPAAEQTDWCNALDEKVLQQVKHDTGPLWVYMPTYRDNNGSLQLNLQQINSVCRQYHRSMILKLHPFISRRLAAQFSVEENAQTLLRLPGFSNLYLYPSGMNIYPWLAASELLITDYSSVATDYLLHHGAIVLYQYDRADYKDVRGAFLVDDDYFTAGPVVESCEALCQLLGQFVQHGDQWQGVRQQLKQKLQLSSTPAMPKTLRHIRQLAQLQ